MISPQPHSRATSITSTTPRCCMYTIHFQSLGTGSTHWPPNGIHPSGRNLLSILLYLDDAGPLNKDIAASFTIRKSPHELPQ